jgi:hypothetical protein
MLKDIEFDFSISQKFLGKSKSKIPKSEHKVDSQISESNSYIEILWNKRYNELRKFFNENKHSFYKRKHGNIILYNWIQTQRVRKRKGLLTTGQVKLLDEIKFVWNPKSTGGPHKTVHWLEMFNKLKAFKMEFGHSNVSQLDAKFKTLGRWVNDQRCYKKGKLLKGKVVYLPKERELLLESIGFEWDRIDNELQIKLNLMIEFKNIHGHFNIKQSEAKYKALYFWLNKIRRNGTSAEKLQKLKDIGYDVTNFKVKSDDDKN